MNTKKRTIDYKFVSIMCIIIIIIMLLLLSLYIFFSLNNRLNYTITLRNLNNDNFVSDVRMNTIHGSIRSSTSIFLYNNSIYRIVVGNPVQARILYDGEIVSWLIPNYIFPIGKVYNKNNVLLLGERFEETFENNNNIQMRNHLSDCIVLVDMQTGKNNLLFSTVSGNRIVHASIENDVVAIIDNFSIRFYRISTMELLRRDSISSSKLTGGRRVVSILENGKNYIFETKENYLHLYERDDGLIERFSLIFE